MAIRLKSRDEGSLIAMIADEDTVAGLLLVGVGNVDEKKRSNFLVVDSKTKQTQIVEAFKQFTRREDVCMLIISQHVANQIRFLIDEYDRVVPAIVEVPSKDYPYDPAKDSLLERVKRLNGSRE
eukprot:TRINITY_DN92_c0_g1_i1.p1 TRINITY_DN92_c0_g1~~TRINITY_DN92_c0_g1_i1.p1  ORF type:complete len:124 (-),score=55.58 TRINITY_DN92_c0_g1_i1:143-514(-)